MGKRGVDLLICTGGDEMARDIASTGMDNVNIIATAQKINALKGRPFLVDTGDSQTDWLLTGYYTVITDYREYGIYRASP